MRKIMGASILVGVLAVVMLADDRRAHTASGERAEICVRGHSETLRLQRGAYYRLRDAAFDRAGMPTSMQCHEGDSRPDCFILDHIIPLELCLAADNCNRLDNIQIQARVEAEAKDRIENEERYRFCRGEETRAQAIAHFKRTVP